MCNCMGNQLLVLLMILIVAAVIDVEGISLKQPDIDAEFKAVKLEQKRQRVMEQSRIKREKEAALKTEAEKYKDLKPMVQMEVVQVTTPASLKVQRTTSKTTVNPILPSVVNKKKAPYRAAPMRPPHRPQDIYLRRWNVKDRVAL